MTTSFLDDEEDRQLILSSVVDNSHFKPVVVLFQNFLLKQDKHGVIVAEISDSVVTQILEKYKEYTKIIIRYDTDPKFEFSHEFIVFEYQPNASCNVKLLKLLREKGVELKSTDPHIWSVLDIKSLVTSGFDRFKVFWDFDHTLAGVIPEKEKTFLDFANQRAQDSDWEF